MERHSITSEELIELIKGSRGHSVSITANKNVYLGLLLLPAIGQIVFILRLPKKPSMAIRTFLRKGGFNERNDVQNPPKNSNEILMFHDDLPAACGGVAKLLDSDKLSKITSLEISKSEIPSETTIIYNRFLREKGNKHE